MYLAGEFGSDPDAVNAYAASSFYAVDRYASYKRFWQADYEQGRLILAARYTTSNAIHQMAKLPAEEWDAYLTWLEDYEYGRLGLPRPDQVVFLDMPPHISQRLMTRPLRWRRVQKGYSRAGPRLSAQLPQIGAVRGRASELAGNRLCRREEPRPLEDITQELRHCLEPLL